MIKFRMPKQISVPGRRWDSPFSILLSLKLCAQPQMETLINSSVLTMAVNNMKRILLADLAQVAAIRHPSYTLPTNPVVQP